MNELKSGRALAASLYVGLGNKTLSRDLNYLREKNLVVVEDGTIKANLDAMNEFMATNNN